LYEIFALLKCYEALIAS